MSLVSQLSSLATRVATEFNNLRQELATAIAGKADVSALNGKADLSGATFSGNVGVNGTFSTPNELVVSDLIGSGQLRLIDGSYGVIVRNDGSNTYFLITASGDQYGGWNSLRPIAFSHSTGVVTLNNGSVLNGAVYTNSAQSTSSGTARFRNVRISTGNPSGGLDGDVWLKYS